TAGSSKLRQLFAGASKSKLLGVGIGTLTAAAIQSSGATTVIVIGFLNAGSMSLIQAATVIFGANIGTTVTGQIVAWGMSGGGGLSTTAIFSGLAGIGAFTTTFGKSDRAKTVGGILTGFGMLFVGLELMGGSMESFADYEPVRAFLASIKNPFLLVAIGAILTAIIESSSVMTSVAITMIVAGLITFSQGVYITMGSNIGACIVSLLASMAGTTNARRAPVINLTFNIGGAIVFLLLDVVLNMVSGGNLGIGTPFEAMFPGAPQIQLAMFHTAYNIGKVIIALPLTEAIVRLAVKVVPDAPEVAEEDKAAQLRPYYISEALLATPPIAVQQTRNEIVNMAEIAISNARIALECARTLDFSRKEEFDRNEAELDYLNQELSRYMARLFGEQLSEHDRDYLSHALHSISDLERVGDYATNIVEYAQKLAEEENAFSPEAQSEIAMLEDFIDKLYTHVIHAYIMKYQESYDSAKAAEAAIDLITDQMAQNHVGRVANGICTPEVGAHYIGLISDAERIGDHFYNLTKARRGFQP
ncbi:MAG: Na/Pi cotransporter family protein, partial [Atopobiaceae bacterium]|nr:Na/Pi cotransporter family protein [Atopobiaceae bacterium]